MKTTWIITSALVTDVGVYDTTARIIQTHETINSIQKYFPDAKLVLVEGGKRLPNEHPLYENLKARCHVNLDMTGNDQIKHLQENFLGRVQNRNEMGGTTGLTKSIAELTLMASVLDALKNHSEMEPAADVDRIFKISGRYQLSPLFDPAVYDDSVQGKYVFRQRDASWMQDALKNVGTDHGYSSRLWSFDKSQLDDTLERFNSMIEDCLDITQKYYIDMEHLLFKHFSDANPVELEHTHLYGTIAPTGTCIYD